MSVFGEETNAFIDSFDASYAMRDNMQKRLQQNIASGRGKIFRLAVQVIVKSSSTTENRLMIYLQATREAYKEQTIN